MGKNTNKRKAEFLGMPHGTASNRLKKKIMLNLLQKLGEDYCYRCGDKIETPEELSIEHKEFWLDVDVDLFWDLENIAFSHLSCNNQHKRFNPPHKITPPEGMGWCSRCRKFLPEGSFGRRPDGRTRAYCNECRKARGWDRSSRRPRHQLRG